MAAGISRPTDPIARLAKQISDLQAAVTAIQQSPKFMIPVRASDPDAAEPINIWMFPDGRIRARHWNLAGNSYVIREWIPTAAGSSNSATAPASPASAPISRSATYTASWSASYTGAGVAIAAPDNWKLCYGSYDPALSRTRSLIGLPNATIAAALSGSTIESITLTIQNISTGWPAETIFHVGIHNFSSAPASWAGGSLYTSMVAKFSFKPTETKTVTLPLSFATSIRDGLGKGIAIESPTDDVLFAGVMSGVGGNYLTPTVTINYAK